MDELKLLIGMVKDLPAMAIWLLVIFYGYKVIIVGSIYGVIRFGISRLHSWATTPKDHLIRYNVTGQIDGMTITKGGAHEALLAQLNRLRGKRTGIDSDYIHECSVAWLRDAIDAKEADDREQATRKASAPAPVRA